MLTLPSLALAVYDFIKVCTNHEVSLAKCLSILKLGGWGDQGGYYAGSPSERQKVALEKFKTLSQLHFQLQVLMQLLKTLMRQLKSEPWHFWKEVSHFRILGWRETWGEDEQCFHPKSAKIQNQIQIVNASSDLIPNGCHSHQVCFSQRNHMINGWIHKLEYFRCQFKFIKRHEDFCRASDCDCHSRSNLKLRGVEKNIWTFQLYRLVVQICFSFQTSSSFNVFNDD